MEAKLYDINQWCWFVNAFNALFRTEKNLELARVLLSPANDIGDLASFIISDKINKSNFAGKRAMMEYYIRQKYNLSYCKIYDGYDEDTTVIFTTDEYVPLSDRISVYTTDETVPTGEDVGIYTVGESNGDIINYKVEVIESELAQSVLYFTDNILTDVQAMSFPNQVYEITYK